MNSSPHSALKRWLQRMALAARDGMRHVSPQTMWLILAAIVLVWNPMSVAFREEFATRTEDSAPDELFAEFQHTLTELVQFVSSSSIPDLVKHRNTVDRLLSEAESLMSRLEKTSPSVSTRSIRRKWNAFLTLLSVRLPNGQGFPSPMESVSWLPVWKTAMELESSLFQHGVRLTEQRSRKEVVSLWKIGNAIRLALAGSLCCLALLSGRLKKQDQKPVFERAASAPKSIAQDRWPTPTDWTAKCSVGLVKLNRRGAVIAMNSSARRVLGPVLLDGSLDWWDLFASENPELLRCEWKRLTAGTTSISRLVQYNISEGRDRSLLIEVANCHTNESGFILTFTDVSDLLSQERQSNQRLQWIAGSVPAMIWTSGVDGRRDYWNDNWLLFRGTTPQEELSGGGLGGIHPDDLLRYRSTFEAGIRKSESFSSDFRLRRADGNYRCIEETVAVLRTASGQVAGFIGCCRDVTESRRRDEERRARVERFELAIRGSNDGVWDADLIKEEIFCSPRLDEILGYGPGELPKSLSEFRSLVHPADMERTESALNAHLDFDIPYDVEHRLRCKNGDFRWLRCRGRSVRGEDGKAIRLAGSTTDISESKMQHAALVRYASEMEEARIRIEDQAGELAKKAEELEIANRQVRAASRSKGEFLANMSHEIRTPLNAIIGLTELVLDGRLEPESRSMLDTVRTSGEHLLSLINDILDFSKIEANKLRLDPIRFALSDCVNQSVSMFRLIAEKKGIALNAYIADHVPKFAVGDVGRLRQVLVNLISNAVKFTSAGSVDVRVSCVDSSDSEVWLEFEIADSGIGIPTSKLDDIFSPFEQADGSTTRKFGGSGLGLSIVRKLVEMMGGKVIVTSEVGVGSRFVFTARLSRTSDETGTASAKAQSCAPPRAAGESLKILVAEDHPVNQMLISRLLKSAGHSVEVVDDGRKVVAAVQTRQYDLVLMDLHMPLMSGLVATAEIRRKESRSGNRTPIVALTANAMAGDREKCFAAGMDGYVPKPIRSEQLFAEIVRVCHVTPTSQRTELFSQESLLEKVGHDVELLTDLVSIYAGTAPALNDQLRTAVREKCHEQVHSLAHQLKGATGLFGAEPIVQKLQFLETKAESSPDSYDEREAEQLHEDIIELVKELELAAENRTPKKETAEAVL